jgi:ABC-type Mn2+/Zn2+ transport system permease subunit
MNTLGEMLRADFLLHNALVGSILVGLVCPLVGVYFVLRRMIFLGVALPQLSAAGVAFAFLANSLAGVHQHGATGERTLAMAGALGFAFIGLIVLAALERHGRETLEGRIGVTYAFAAAASILFVAADPYGEWEMMQLLRGDIVTTTSANLTLLEVVLGGVAVALLLLRKELLLVSFDRDLAVVLGKNAVVWDIVLYLLIGVTISFGVMTAGPLVTFGFLVVPPLTARLITRHMLTFSLTASGLGALTAFVGFYLAYRLDLPLGPTNVVLATFGLLSVAAIKGLAETMRRQRLPC